MLKPSFSIANIDKANFEKYALEVFHYQASENPVYKEFLNRVNCNALNINKIADIPFLPIGFFKSHRVVTGAFREEQVFLSSGTTGMQRSKHYVVDSDLYRQSFRKAFEYFYGSPENYTILALLPSYIEQQQSSLVFMMDDLIRQSHDKNSGFYLKDYERLAAIVSSLDASGKKVFLIGVTYALLDLLEVQTFHLKNTIVMETGGMKGRRKEMIKSALHQVLQKGFGVSKIHSEYGMTELLTQAYSQGDGRFQTPPWMQVFIREPEDPFHFLPEGKSGGINLVDLANIHSCSFIATQDLGKKYANGQFEILGRFDHSDIRGCNLML